MNEILKELKNILIENNIDKNEAAAEVDFILKYLLNIKYEDIILQKKINNKIFDKAYKIVKKRAFTKKPLMQILGFTIFMNNKFKVSKDTLIPRVETELLIRTCENLISQNSKVLEIGCGSGIISIMLNKIKNCKVDSCDISIEALKIAKLNSKNLQTNVNFFYSDLFKNVNSKYDLIVSNPPYIPLTLKNYLQEEVKNFEPHIALFTNDNLGVEYYQKIIKNAFNYLLPGGFVAFELGINQAELVKNIFIKNNYKNIQTFNDLNNIARVIIAQI